MARLSRKQFLRFLSRWSGRTALMALLPFSRFVVASQLKEARRRQKPKTGDRDVHAAVDANFVPSYVRLHEEGELLRRGRELRQMMSPCCLCPRVCGADRLSEEKGFCQSSRHLKVASYHPHMGEERPLVGRGGSGTIFFTNCSLRCVFCINADISQGGVGRKTSLDDLAEMMLALQRRGCHNINIVTPTHYSADLVLALDLAATKGLRLPLVYNTHGWERLEVLKLLDGVVDIYLPDFKYWDPVQAGRYSSGADSYPETTKAALLEMHRQTGVAKPASDGLMYRGLMIRHLVMPNSVSGSVRVVQWIGENLPRDTYLNIMSQYRPAFKAGQFPAIARPLNRGEYQEVVDAARSAGLTNLDIQGHRWI